MRQRKDSAQPLPSTVSQLANTYHLGALTGAYPKTRTSGVIRLLIACGLLLLALLLGFLPTARGGISLSFANGINWPAISLYTGLALLAPSLVYVMICCFYLFSGRVYAFTDGFIYVKPGQSHVFRWEDVEHVQERQIRGSSSLLVHAGTIKRVDGYRVLLNIREINQFLTLLHQRVPAARRLKLQKAYEAGAVISFGPLGVSREGVGYEKRLLPWSQVDQVFLLSGTLHIRSKEKQTDWAMITEAERIPNISLFVELTMAILKADHP